MKKLMYLFAFSAVVIASCGKKDNSTVTPPPAAPAKAKVMYTNVCVGTSSVFVKVNDTALSTVTGLAYGANSGYVSVSPGSAIKSSFILSGTALSVGDTTANLVANNNYSVFLTGSLAPSYPEAIVLTSDNLSTPSSGKSKIRLINLSPNNYNASLFVDTTTLITGVTYKMSTSFMEISNGSHSIRIQDPAFPAIGQDLTPTQNFMAGKIYTILLSGTYNIDPSMSTLKASIITNN